MNLRYLDNKALAKQNPCKTGGGPQTNTIINDNLLRTIIMHFACAYSSWIALLKTWVC